MKSADEHAPVALVTGAARGIGRAIALRLAREGYDLELTDCLGAELDATVHALEEPARANAEVVELRDRAAQDAWIASVRRRRPRLDVLVHNAGVGGPDPEDDTEATNHLGHVLDVNVTAPFRLSRGLLDRLPKDGRGRIVVLASVLGKMGVPGFAAYGASKAAVIGLVRAMAKDLARDRITVNAVCPGWTDTAMAQQGFEAIASEAGTTPEEARADVERGLPLGRIVSPDEVAGLVAYLASAEAGAMTGQAITMSAGDLQR